MPKAFLKTKNRGGTKVYTCSRCGEAIAPGEDYYTWKFNHGGRYFQHAHHGYPLRSQLTNSKMGPVWDAVDTFDVSGATSVDDIRSDLEAVAGAAREVADEYNSSADSIEGSWPSGNPTSQACRDTADALEAFADEIEAWTPDYDEWDKEQFDSEDDWLEDCRNSASELMNDCPEYQG